MGDKKEGEGGTHESLNTTSGSSAGRESETESRQWVDLRRALDMTAEIHPLEMFPLEIWEQILGEVYHGKTLKNLWDAHPLFPHILEGRRLRDIILPRLIDEGVIIPMTNSSQTALASKVVIPLSQFVELRSISKTMRNSVDNWFEENLMKRINSRMEYEVPTINIRFLMDLFRFPKILADFEGKNGTSAKRLVYRSLMIDTSIPSNVIFRGRPDFERVFAEFKLNILDFLDIVGDQIWLFTFFVQNLDQLASRRVWLSQVYAEMVEWVRRMPKLKWLDIKLDVESCFNLDKTTLTNTIKHQPFPTCMDLEKISLKLTNLNWNYIGEIYEAVLRTNSNVKFLNLDMLGCTYAPAAWPWLKSIPYVRNTPVITIRTSFLSPVQAVIKTLDWPLRNFRLHIHSAGNDRPTALSTMIKILNKLPTLERVSLNIGNMKMGRDFTFLELPDLMHFELIFDSKETLSYPEIEKSYFYFSLQFLLHAKNLKMIKWKNECHNSSVLLRYLKMQEIRVGTQKEERIDFRGGLRDLCQSNMWDIFPHLESIRVEVKEWVNTKFAYRRTEYKRKGSQ